MLLLTTSYVCDVTTAGSRTVRITGVYIAGFLGDLLGTYLCTVVYEQAGLEWLLFYNQMWYFLAFLYIAVFLKDIVPKVKEQGPYLPSPTASQNCLMKPINILLANFKVLTVKRPGYNRARVNLLLSSMILQCFPSGGEFQNTKLLNNSWNVIYSVKNFFLVLSNLSSSIL